MLEITPRPDEMQVDTETVFGLSGVGLQRGEVYGERDMDYMAQLDRLINDAEDYEQSYLALKREELTKYYEGLEPALPGKSEGDEASSPNKSSFISSDVRDTILTILPSLVRIFMSSERIANFVPTEEKGQDLADQAYDYCNYVFYKDNPGFLILHGVFKDALIRRAAFVKWWTDNSYEVTEQTFQNITEEQFMYLLSEYPDVEIEEIEQGEDGTIAYLCLKYKKPKPVIKVEAIPPEEFRINKGAKDVKSARLVGHEYIASPSDLIQKGVPEEAIEEVGYENQTAYSDERFLRNPSLVDDGVTRGILFGEFYVRLDKDGDGVDELRQVWTLGSSRIVVRDNPVANINIALWSVDPTPHTAIGDSLADLVIDIQKIKTNMIRGQLDNLAESINPRMVVNELLTNVADALSDEIGAIIRTRGDPNTAVSYTRMPYAGAEVQESINYLDQVRGSRTGITEASKGLDPKAMQSTALSGIDAIVSGAQERIELIARILAETGFKDMIEGILREMVNNPSHARQVRMNSKWQTVNPSIFDPNMTIEVNPTLGKGSDMMRLQVLADVREVQTQVISMFGIANPVVTPEHYLHTVQDMMEIGNVKNFHRYFGQLTPEILEAIQTAPKEPDPASVLAQAELEKTKVKTLEIIGKTDKDRADITQTAIKQKQDDDFRRDKLSIGSLLEIASLFGQTVESMTSPESILALNQPPSAGE